MGKKKSFKGFTQGLKRYVRKQRKIGRRKIRGAVASHAKPYVNKQKGILKAYAEREYRSALGRGKAQYASRAPVLKAQARASGQKRLDSAKAQARKYADKQKAAGRAQLASRGVVV